MQSVPYLFTDAVVSQLNSFVFQDYDISAYPKFRGGLGVNEFVNSVWQSAFETHRKQRINLTVIFCFSGDEISYNAHTHDFAKWISLTDIAAAEWHFYRIAKVEFHKFSLGLRNSKKISVDETLELIDFLRLHSSKRELMEVGISLQPCERILQKLNDLQLPICNLSISRFLGDVDFCMTRCDDSTLEGLAIGIQKGTDFLPVMNRFCLKDTEHPRCFVADFEPSTNHDFESILKRTIDNWKALPNNHFNVSLESSSVLDAVGMLKDLLGVTPDVQTDTRSGTPLHFFKLNHPKENKFLTFRSSQNYFIRFGTFGL